MGDTDWGALAGAGAQIAGGIGGNLASQADRDKALALLREMQAKYGALADPKFADVAPDLQGPSQLAGLRADPALLAQEQGVDQGLKNVVDQGGLTLQDRAAQAQIYDKLARQTSAGNAAIRNNAAARGALNSGSSLALQLAGQQQGVQQASDAARDISAGAQANSLKAMQQRYANASQMDNSQYARQAAAAEAADAINAHNASARRNAGIYANNQNQQQFSNQFTKLNGQQSATNNLSGAYGTEADSKQALGNSIGNAAAAYAYQNKPKRQPSGPADPQDEWSNPYGSW